MAKEHESERIDQRFRRGHEQSGRIPDADPQSARMSTSSRRCRSVRAQQGTRAFSSEQCTTNPPCETVLCLAH